MTRPFPRAPGRILAAVDFDGTAGAVLQHAYMAASADEAPLTVLHVVDDIARDGEAPEAHLRALLDEVLPHRPMPQLRIASGRPETTIPDVAEATGAHLIVVGTHGRGIVGRWAIGSAAEEVVQLTACPVLCVQAPPEDVVRGPVVAAVDLEDASGAVVRQAARTASATGAGLRLVHVLPGGSRSRHDASARDLALTSLRELQAYCAPPDVEVDIAVVLSPEPRSTAIAQDADATGAARIVLAAHGLSGSHIGDVTGGVMHETTRPVLIVHPPPAGADGPHGPA